MYQQFSTTTPSYSYWDAGEPHMTPYTSMHAGAAYDPFAQYHPLTNSTVPKEDNEAELQDPGKANALGEVAAQNMLDQDTISVTIVDSEGPRIYFQKSYKLGMKTNIKKALDQIRSHVCLTCSKPQMLEFWFETTELECGQSAALLGMQNGATIDIRLKEACTRGAHPLPASQTSPNMHYLDTGVYSALQEDTQPPAQKPTVNLTFRNDTRFSMKFRLNVDQSIAKACESFEVRLGMSVGLCRFHCEGERLDRAKTPLEMELEDEDIIECYTEILGGSRQSSRDVAENFSHPLKPRPTPAVIIEQITLIFVDQYQHRLPVAIPNDGALKQALKYVAYRIGKNPGNVAFEIAGRTIDVETHGMKSPLELAIPNGTEIKVRYALSEGGSNRDPDDSLPPRSVQSGVRPVQQQSEDRRA